MCPSGVEKYAINDVVVSIRSGLNPRQNFKFDSKATNFYVTVKEISSGKIKLSNKTDKIDDDAINVIQRRSGLEVDDVLFSGIGTIGKVAIVDIPTENWNCSESVYLLKPNKSKIFPRFLYYILQSDEFQNQMLSTSVGSTLSGVRFGLLKNLKVPVPPLPVQEEIVRILDEFTELEVELEAELEARTKQYEYYRNTLLDFSTGKVGFPKIDQLLQKYCPDGVPYVTLGNTCRINRGKVFSKQYIRNNPGVYPLFSSQTLKDGLMGMIDTHDYDGEYLNWTTDGANAGTIFYRTGKFSVTNVSGLLKPINNEINIRYLMYTLQIIMKSYVSGGMGNPKLMSNVVSGIKYPLPPLPIQEEIVRILDEFSEYTTSLTKGLPAEIELRKKQHEYYRNQLLTF
jgi:type I restriction enzyme S subunit